MQQRGLSVEEIAAHLGVNRHTIYHRIERKKMPAHKVGRPYRPGNNLITKSGRSGEPIWLPVRRHRSRVLEILRTPSASKDQLLLEAVKIA